MSGGAAGGAAGGGGPGDGGPGDGAGVSISAADRTAVLRVHAAFRDWMEGQALPFWAGPGSDGAGRGFHEHMTLAGEGPGEVPKRVRVQARQVYVYSNAAVLGWAGGAAAARHGWTFLRQAARADGHWSRALSPQGAVVDATADLYDLAFVLFASAWYARASGEDEPLVLAARTLGWIRATMGAPGGGLWNTWPAGAGHRQQNPHMHMLEAVLALHAATGDAAYAAYARELLALFRTRFFEPATGTLGEFFDERLGVAEGEAGSHVEPGHHYEWVWLLDRAARQLGEWHAAEAEALYAFAGAHGVDGGRGLVRDVVGRDGVLRRGSFRLWAQTEALKAHVVMLERGHDSAGDVVRAAEGLLGLYLGRARAGTWIDQLDADAAPVSVHVPASSFYHLFMGYAELDRLARLLA